MKKDEKKSKEKKFFFGKKKVVIEETTPQLESETFSFEHIDNNQQVTNSTNSDDLKRQKKEQKARAKVDKVINKSTSQKHKNWFFRKNASMNDKKSAKKALLKKKDLKQKKVKGEQNFSLALKEFPVKMVKEVSKIRWSSKENILIKFIQVLVFILAFAALFYLVDLALQEIFMLIRVII